MSLPFLYKYTTLEGGVIQPLTYSQTKFTIIKRRKGVLNYGN